MARTASTQVTVPYRTQPKTWGDVPGRWATWQELTTEVAYWSDMVPPEHQAQQKTEGGEAR